MQKTVYPDATTTIAIATEIVISLKSIIGVLGDLGNPAKKRETAQEIKNIADTARLISLRLVSFIGDRAFDFTEMVETGKIEVNAAKIETLTAVMKSLHRYVSGVASGKIGSGFNLHAPYVELMRLMPGQPVVSRQELFLPVSPVYGPNSPNYSEGRFVAEVARYNDEFRQAMKRYEVKKDLETVNAMRTTLVTMETKNPPSNFRMLLSLAISFMDIAMRNGGKIPKENEPLISKLDKELAGVVQGETDIDEGTISWFMYVIGQANQFSARIRSFQESYELVRLVDESLNLTINDQTVMAMRNALTNVQRTWEASMVINGDVGAAKSACFALSAVSNTLGDYALKVMALSMGILADAIVEKNIPADSEIAIFGASIVVSMNDRLDRVLADPKGGRASADYHRDRVRQVVSGKRPSELSREISNQGGHIAAILSELSNDLSSAEQIIDQCLRDGARQVKRDDVDKLFNIVKSALSFVNLIEASDYSAKVAGHVDKLLQLMIEGGDPTVEDKRIMAESVMMLHRYISLVNIDQIQAQQLINRGQALFFVAEETQIKEDEKLDGTFDVCHDTDLGPIFFEEAKGVVTDLILPGLAKLRTNIDDETTMYDVRRGFHTLKGSSRMVELNNLGMVGQHTEYVLNIYRDNRNIIPGTALIDWLEGAAHFFYSAVELLEKGLPARVNVGPYEAVYNHFAETNVFERVDLNSAVVSLAPQEISIVDEPIASSIADLMVHIPETGSVIMPALGLTSENQTKTFVLDTSNTDISLPSVDATEKIELNIIKIDAHDEISVPQINDFAAIEKPTETIDFVDLHKDVESAALAPEAHAEIVKPVDAIVVTKIEGDGPIVLALENFPVVPVLVHIVEVQEIGDTVPMERVEDVTDTVIDIPAPTGVESSDEVHVGDIVIPTQLYLAFINEASTFQGVLSKAIFDVVNGKRTSVDFEVMRMAHSLAGMGRATDLKALTHLAEKVEEWVSLNQDRQVYITDNARAVLMDAMEALDAMIMGVQDKLEPMMEVTIVHRLSEIIDQDERRISMAEDTRANVADSVIEQLVSQFDMEVSDDGVAPSSPSLSSGYKVAEQEKVADDNLSVQHIDLNKDNEIIKEPITLIMLVEPKAVENSVIIETPKAIEQDVIEVIAIQSLVAPIAPIAPIALVALVAPVTLAEPVSAKKAETKPARVDKPEHKNKPTAIPQKSIPMPQKTSDIAVSPTSVRKPVKPATIQKTKQPESTPFWKWTMTTAWEKFQLFFKKKK